MQLTTRTEEDTRQIGRLIGKLAGPGLVLALYGGLGSGKTVLVRGLARGLGVSEQTPVTSPTFTLINEYAGRLLLFHADLYRIAHCAELEEIGFEEMFNGKGVVAVEWAENCDRLLPADRLEIRFRDPEPEIRILSLNACGQHSEDLLQALRKQMEAS
ncbi:MAG: tRNA (adenosine(37)-N6)-threonylcarbamoyltransferase complex ATPase subunit type 1 TsaE [Desulfobacterales bacterium]|nr:tRNA (adenosine(37)-N6)-threonylcarbamoyltransferase complex ATPase subunit type 1 TsaE [Desulfobacterales bacterium]